MQGIYRSSINIASSGTPGNFPELSRVSQNLALRPVFIRYLYANAPKTARQIVF